MVVASGGRFGVSRRLSARRVRGVATGCLGLFGRRDPSRGRRFVVLTVVTALAGTGLVVVGGGGVATAGTGLGVVRVVGQGVLSSPNTVAVNQSSGDVFVADTNLNEVLAFDATGNPVPALTISSSSLPSGESLALINVTALAVDNSSTASKGDIYVRNNATGGSDGSGGVVDQFSPTGTFLAEWTGAGSPEGKLNAPGGIAVDSSGNVYISNYYDGTVDEFTSAGTYVTQFDRSLESGRGCDRLQW